MRGIRLFIIRDENRESGTRAALRAEHVGVRDFVPVLIANALPLGGLAVPGSGMRLYSVYLLYWFESLTPSLGYCGRGTFVQRAYVEEPETPSLSASWSSVRFHRAVPRFTCETRRTSGESRSSRVRYSSVLVR